MLTEFIFVYGTLRRKADHAMHDILATHCRYFSEAYMQGRLYEVNRYPGAVASAQPEERVVGELYQIINANTVLAKLDQYEECAAEFPHPHEYIRKPLQVSLPQGGTVCAWVYLFNHDTTQLQQIKSGDYLKYLQENKSN